MRFKIGKSVLKGAMSIASKALPKAVIQVERGHLLFSVREDKLYVTGSNNDLRAYVESNVIENESEEQISFTVDPKILEKLIVKIDMEEILFDYNPQDLTLQIFTSEDEKSFNTMQSFPVDKMLTVDGVDLPFDSEIVVAKDVFLKSLIYCERFLEMREENKRFDFVIYNNGVAFGSNGLNRMGFFVASEIRELKNLKIRKVASPHLVYILKSIEDEQVIVGEQGNSIIICNASKSVYFAFLKSAVESPKISLDMLKKEGAFTAVDRIELNKKLKRLFATKMNIAGAGIQMTLTGEEGASNLEMRLLANLKAVENMSCSRVGDGSEDIEHIVDCGLLQGIVESCESDIINLYINTESPFFKIYEVIKNEKQNQKFITVGVGSYSRIIKK